MLVDFLRSIAWPATLQLAGVRLALAAIIWPVVMALTGNVNNPGDFFGLIMVWAIGLAATVFVAISAIGLSRGPVRIFV